MTHLIEHIIEPETLLLAWQSLDEKDRTRHIVAELYRVQNEISMTYLTHTKDFERAQAKGFECYPAFQDTSKTHLNVLNAFMRRLPPRTRDDFAQYLEGLRLPADTNLLSDFALLGYSGAKLLSDGFSIIHPFTHTSGPCELLVEIAGFRHMPENHNKKIEIGASASFVTQEIHPSTNEPAILIMVNGENLGYVNRGLIPTFLNWMENDRVAKAWVEKINGSPGKPTVYLYVKISAEKS